jgi:hypothetical protein
MRYSNVAKEMAGVFVVLTFSSLSLWAQFTSGIEGTVSDPSGAVVPNANVTLMNLETGITRTAQAGAAGYYRLTSLPAAVFKITVTASGFKTMVREDVRTEVAEIKTVNITLELGAANTVVTVTGTPPPVELSEGRVSGVIEESKVHEMPLVGRNFYTLVVLTPGITGLPSGGGQAYAQATADIFNNEYGVNMNAGGQRSESNNFLIDSSSVTSGPRGGVANVNPNAESVQELRVLVNNFSAEYGRNAAAVVDVVTKQGTNKFHGSASWFHTDNVLQSRNIFQDQGPVFRRNEAAWSLGGPIWKDHTFFFGSMDILRSGVGSGYAAPVATQDFAHFLDQVHPNYISTYLLDTFKPSIVPNRSFITAGDQQGVACDSSNPAAPISTPIGPVPCNLKLTGVGDMAVTSPRNGLQWNVRLDHMFNNSRDRLYGSAIRTTLQLPNTNIYPDFNVIQPLHSLYLNLNETHTFSANFLNEMAFGYTRPSGSSPQAHPRIPEVDVPGMSSIGIWSGGFYVQNNFEWRDVASFNRGSHSFKAGFILQRAEDNADETQGFYSRDFGFNTIWDFANDQPATEGPIIFDPRTGKDVQDYSGNRQHTYGLFFQDDWKLRPNLSVGLGLRWESFGRITERNNHLTNIVFQGGDNFIQRIANAKVDVVPYLWNGDYDNFGPRLGFAWDPTKKGKVSVRGGMGTFYDRPSNQIYTNGRSNPPIVAVTSASIYTPPILPVFGLAQSDTFPYGWPPVPGLGPGLDAKNGLINGKVGLETSDPNLRTQYSENWFFGIQYSFANNWLLEGNYIGTAGHKIYGVFNVDRFAGDLVKNKGVITGFNSSFGSIDYAQSLFNSIYNGGNVSIKKRFGRGLDFQAAYTFGKAIDDASTFGPGLAVLDAAHLQLERGLADFDVRQKIALSLLWQLPARKTGSAALNKFLSGWEVGDITILQAGLPFSVRCSLGFIPIFDNAGNVIGNSGCDYNADGNAWDAPNAPSWGNFKNGLSRSDFIRGIFTPADFPAPGLGMDGTLGRNTFRGPNFENTDLSISKTTKVPWFVGREGANLQFRAEFFNIFNRVNMSGVNSDLANPGQFGTSSNTFPARNIQFGLRLSF